MRALLFLLILVSSSCAIMDPPQERAKRRIDKLLTKFPEISQQEKSSSIDTLIRLDSILTKEVSIDTIFNFNSDTVFVVSEGGVSTEVQVFNREKIRVKTLVRSDTIYFRDTLIREQTIIREIVKPLKASFFEKYGIILILSAVFILAFMLYKLI